MRKKLTPDDVDGFLKMYGRRSETGREPNDRQYSRRMEEAVKRLDPRDLDALMRGEDVAWFESETFDQSDATTDESD